MFDVIAIGDTTTDAFLDIDEATVNCEINKPICRLCINYDDKVPVRCVTKLYGVGNAANHAVGMARLGMKSALYTMLGKDDDGEAARDVVIEEGVAPDYIVMDTEKGTNYSTVLNFDGERTILVYHEHREYQLPKLDKTNWIYYTSVAEGHEPLNDQLLAYLEQNPDTKLAYNPGTFQLKTGKAGVEPILKRTTVLFVNKHEAERILELPQTEDIGSLIAGLRQLGPEQVVITNGSEGSFCNDGDDTYTLGVLEVPVVERTGCGDAFATGFLAARMKDLETTEAMRWGSANAASVLQKIGAQASLLTQKEIEDMLAHSPQFQAKPM